MTVAIGVDVGGTKIEFCLFDAASSSVVAVHRVPTNVDGGGRSVLAQCVTGVSTLLSAHGLSAVDVPLGLCICELVDLDGRTRSAATVDWRDLDPAAAFPQHPVVVIESDVRAAASAEAQLGAGRGVAQFVYLSVGTGISFALVLDGAPYRGARGHALILGAPPVEQVASGSALAKQAGFRSAVDACNHPDDASSLLRAAHHLGGAMAWLVNALDPEVIVIGGGLGLRVDYRTAAIAAMRALIETEDARRLDVVAAELGESAASVGAAWLAAQQYSLSRMGRAD